MLIGVADVDIIVKELKLAASIQIIAQLLQVTQVILRIQVQNLNLEIHLSFNTTIK